MDLLQSGDSQPAAGGLTLNLDASLSSDALPPLTFLADASLWFEEHGRRADAPISFSALHAQSQRLDGAPQQPLSAATSWPHETLDMLVSAANVTRGATACLPDAAPHGPVARGCEADRLEVARIMEQLKKGWDGTTKPADAPSADGISCHFANNTLSVDLRPLFSHDLQASVQKASPKDSLPVRLRFPSGVVTVLVPLTQLWPPAATDPSAAPPAAQDIPVSERNLLIDEDGRKRWKCHLCDDKIYASRSALQCHFLLHTNSRPYACALCDKAFRQMGHWQTHMMLHTGQKQHECSKCGRRFTQKPHLTRHYESCGVDSSAATRKPPPVQRCRPALPKVCPQCSKSVVKLKRHLQLAHGVGAESRPFICSECGLDFKLAHQHKVHMRVHSSARAHACPQCPHTFRLAAHLKRHTATAHSHAAGPLACAEGGRRFGRTDSLREHERTHALPGGALPCDECDKRFRRPGRLREHKERAHGNQPTPRLRCPQCGLSFTRAANLQRHQKRHCAAAATQPQP